MIKLYDQFRRGASSFPIRAMTLIEVLAVVVILGLLAVTLTVGISAKLGKAKREICKTQIADLIAQIQAYQLVKRAVPTAAQGLQSLSTDPSAIYHVDAEKLKDPWGNPFRYLVPGPNGSAFEISSLGSDNQPGGEGEAADVSSAHLASE
jgi:general secretion pathway protein G